MLRPGGRVAVATWASVEESPGYAAMVELLEEEIGDWAADALRAPFCLGTPELIGDVLRQSFEDVAVVRHEGQARFTSLDDWLYTEIRGWTLAEHIDDDQYARLRRAAATRLARFVTGDGAVRFAAPALIAAHPCEHSTLGRVSNPTLRVLADLPQQPVSLSESTLILIDCQNTYTRGVMELEGVQEALDEAAALLDRARSAGIPIIHIQHDDGPGSLYDIEGESGAIVARVAPQQRRAGGGEELSELVRADRPRRTC